ncbi:hypothetical protein [Sphingomonas sp.]|uniref:hypothetical protein n=1 Tax=Sphingomonas sp. TaxID=28214 RepID=UPI002600FFE5|nr:hypothetical protein [Sphingomonas sp.]
MARVLQARWPALTTLTPASIGVAEGTDATREFLRTVRELSDAGLLSYEALVVGPTGPVVIDAALTARGREVLRA